MRVLKPFEHIYHVDYGRGITVRPDDIVHRFNYYVVSSWTLSDIPLWALHIHAIFPDNGDGEGGKVVEINEEVRSLVYAEGDYVQIRRVGSGTSYRENGESRFKDEIYTFYRATDHNPTNSSRFTVKDLDGNISYAYDVLHARVNHYEIERIFELRQRITEVDRELSQLRNEQAHLKAKIKLGGRV